MEVHLLKTSVVMLLLGASAVVAQEASKPSEVVYPGPQDTPPNDRFSPGDLKSTLVVPETHVTRFRFPAIDAHTHAYGETPEGVAAWVKLMDQVSVRTSFILTAATGDEFKKLTAQYPKAYPGRFVMFAGFETENIEAADYGDRLRRRLREDVAAGAAGVGELHDKGQGLVEAGGHPYFIDDARFDPLWDEAGRLGVPVFVHIAEPAAFYEPADEHNDLRRSGNWSQYGKGTPGFAALLEKFEKVLQRHPRTRFVAVHSFNLTNDLGGVARLLGRHPNVQVDFAARMWELARQPFTARAFFLKHADRILFGTDNGPDLPMYLAHVRQFETHDEWFWPADTEWWRGYGMDLPAGVLKRIYQKNAEALLVRTPR